MSNLIQWPRAKYWDKAWNPVVGCKPCSPACDNCYARAWAQRFGQSFEPHTTKQKPPRSGVVFCGNITDLFGRWLDTYDMCCNISSTLGYSRKATYLWLTKRVDRMCQALTIGKALLKDDTPEGVDEFPFRDCEMGNQFFGFTAEDGLRMDERSRVVLDEFPRWANLWISCEPLLAPFCIPERLLGGRLKWVVVGCESGSKRRPCKIEWVESIVAQCRAANVPVFVKQIDLNGKFVTDINQFPPHLRIRQVPWAKEGNIK